MEMEICPICQYSLRGLSEPVRCPECGLRLGFDPAIFRASPNPWLVVALGALVSTGVLAFLYFRKGCEAERYLLLVPLVLMFLGSLLRARHERSRFLIVSDDEVRIFTGTKENGVIPLSGVMEARWNWMSGTITFRRFASEAGASFMPPSRRLARAILRALQTITFTFSVLGGATENRWCSSTADA